MKSKEILLEYSKNYYSKYLPHISIDSVIFGFNKNKLRVLLLNMEFNNEWFLPGGYIKKNEDVEVAANRIVKDRTGLDNVFLEEFAIFGNINRSEDTFHDFDDTLWHKQRFVTIGYYALLNYSMAKLIPDALTQDIKWVYVDELDQYTLTMDHREIITKALKKLQENIAFKPIGLNLLPEKFTLAELQKLYEAILGRSLNRGNFYRKIKNIGILKKLDEQRKGGAHKSPDLYTFETENYFKILENGINNW